MPSIAQRGEETDSVSASVALSSATISSPFGLPLDPYELKGKILTSPYNLLLSATYLLSDKIFSYGLLGQTENPENKSVLNLWSNLKRKNLNDLVPELYNLEIRAGCGNLLLGYLNEAKTNDPISVIIPSSALTFMEPVLLRQSHLNLPMSFQVATLDYDFENSKLVSNYSLTLSIAKNLKLPVVTSFNSVESQHLTILSSVLAKFDLTNLHLFDGLSFIKTNETINGALSNEKIKSVYDDLYSILNTRIETVPTVSKVSFALNELNKLLGTNYAPFEYYGPKDAETVFVIYGSNESTNLIKLIQTSVNKKIAAIVIRVPLPFESSEFNCLIPSTLKKLVVIGEKFNGVNLLKLDLQASLFLDQIFVNVVDHSYSSSTLESNELIKIINEHAPESTANISDKALNAGSHFRFLYNDNSVYANIPSKITHALSLVPDLDIQYRPKFNNYINAGLFQADIKTGGSYNSDLDLVVVQDPAILKSIDVISTLKPEGSILVINTPDNKFDEAKFVEKTLSLTFKKSLAVNKLNLRLIDLEAVGEDESTTGRTGSIAIQVAFWKLAYPDLSVGAIVTKILQAFGSEAELLAAVITSLVDKIVEVGFKEIKYAEEWAAESAILGEEKEEKKETQVVIDDEYSEFTETSFAPNPRETFIDETVVQINQKEDLTKKLIFKEAYTTNRSLRPDLPIENFVVKVKENKRLTPSDYDRNIFHIEFDVSGTGLTYNIGEALGIHGRNTPSLIDEFVKMYGLSPDDLVDVVSKDNDSIFETRTIRQSFIENLDLLGKPPKRFYESLAEFATDDAEKTQLTKLGSPAGAELLKTYQEEEFYNYIDIFELYKSARPSAQDLVQLIPALKRREYSIASSQKMHPTEVHLLIVVVDWKDNKGRQRYGQCSKYLSDLRIGEELVVSVKPSIMKLPPLTKQPIIMAGLGTGLAPFKAFVEERHYQVEQGEEIGEIYLFLGSRHKRQEYLYGEYWEAYLNSGIMTSVGAAFSRDQPKKIYIQDKIREDLEVLTDLMINKNGHFYLCGPTWPVPDISSCLQDMLENDAKARGVKIDSAKEVEELKEEGRYVLEVY